MEVHATRDPRGHPPSMPTRRLVWDLPLRLFHWLLAALVVAAIATGTIGGNALEWHMRAGYGILVLLVFRLLWGVWGGHHARFANFVRGPGAIVAYLRGEGTAVAGHSPLGALSVLAMLAALLIQTTVGLFANDDIFTEGPLYKLVSKEISDWLTGLHKRNLYLIAPLVALHVSAVLYYLLVKRHNLIRPMITGIQETGTDTPTTATPTHNLATRAAILLAASAALVWAIVTRT